MEHATLSVAQTDDGARPPPLRREVRPTRRAPTESRFLTCERHSPDDPSLPPLTREGPVV